MLRKKAVWRLVKRSFFLILISTVFLSTLSCNFKARTEKEEEDNGAAETIAAMQAIIDTQTAATVSSPPTPVPTSTIPAIVAPTPIQFVQPPQVPKPKSPAQPKGNFDIRNVIGKAQIVVYEDVAGNPDIRPYVRLAMERLGFRRDDYVYLGDAQGRLFEALKLGALSGDDWDLVIIAAEDRSGVQGQFFELLEGVLVKGTPVILEAWHLDEIREGAIKPVLMRCGVDLVNWYGTVRNPSALKVYPLIPDSPLLNEVFEMGRWQIADYWPYEDQGSLIYKIGTTPVNLVVGTRLDEPNSYGVLAECIDSHLILLTYSSHNYLDETAVPLWMNYIHYMLRMHYRG